MTTTVASPNTAAKPPGKRHASSNPRSRVPLREDDGRLVRGRKSRARIREAALSLFSEKGFDGATLRAIAARAGLGASWISRHVRCTQEAPIDELAGLQEVDWS